MSMVGEGLVQVLLDLDVGLLREFFRAFFADPNETMWRKFLAWDMTRYTDARDVTAIREPKPSLSHGT